MNTTGRLATILIALTIFGCKGPLQTSAANTGDGGNGGTSREGASTASSSGGGTRVENISDTTLNNITAYSVTIPAKWKFKGVVMQGSAAPCGGPSPAFGVWRATSPDGMSYAEMIPIMAWITGTGPQFNNAPKGGCLPLQRPMNAQEFARHLAAMMNVDSVTEEAVPAKDTAKAERERREAQAAVAAAYPNLPPARSTVEMARVVVSFKNGTVPMKGRFNVQLFCRENTSSGFPSMRIPPSTVNKCSALATYIAAPERQFTGVIRQWDAPGMGTQEDKAWDQAWLQRAEQQMAQQGNAFRAGANAQFAAHQRLIQRTMDMQQEQHDQFMQTMQQQGENNRANMRAASDAQSTQASDVVDYALDQKTVVNTNTGVTYKISNQSTALGPEVQVHGDGTQY